MAVGYHEHWKACRDLCPHQLFSPSPYSTLVPQPPPAVTQTIGVASLSLLQTII